MTANDPTLLSLSLPGCKIKALRAKTNTYIKTPVRGEEPVFVVTGRKEDVSLAKREILSAADHFSQIRASRTKNSINSTLAFGQLVANQPGQTTVQVRVPYRVVGLVVGPKGATIKRIQQQTHTYIVTPSRDKEPVFEVTGLPENVEAARKEIEAHIALRTGAEGATGSGGGGMFGNLGDSFGSGSDFHSAFSSSSGHLDHLGGGGSSSNKFNSILNGGGGGMVDSAFSSLTSSSSGNHHHHHHKGITLQNLLDSNNFGDLTTTNHSHSSTTNNSSSSIGIGLPRAVTWSNNGGTESHDSGIGHSPPFENNGHHPLETSLSAGAATAATTATSSSSTGNGIWGELNKMLGGLDLSSTTTGTTNGSSSMMGILNNDLLGGGGSSSNGCGLHLPGNKSTSAFMNVGSRSSLDLGTLGRPMIGGLASSSLASAAAAVTLESNSSSSSTTSNTATGNTPPTTLSLSSAAASAMCGDSNGRAGGVGLSFLHHSHHRGSVSSDPSGEISSSNSSHISNEVAKEAFNEVPDNNAAIVVGEKPILVKNNAETNASAI